MDGMEKLRGVFRALVVLFVVTGLAPAQPAAPATERESLAVTVPERTEGRVRLAGTDRLPSAKGEATVRRRRGTTEIEVKLEQLKPAILFGGDFNTYVLWTVSPEGVAVNAGEFLQRGHRSRVDATTPLSTFGMFVTAEPHFLVDEPSSYVVLQNAESSLTRGSIMLSSVVKYRGFEGRYNADRDTLADEEILEGDFRTERQQATTALNLAERRGAGRWAPEELARAREAVIKALEAYGPEMDEKLFAIEARKAVRLSFEAYQVAIRNRELAEEQAQREELAGLRVAKAEAEAAEAAAREEAERARRERQEALEAKSQAEEAVREAQMQQRLAREMMETAQAETRRLAGLKAQADRYANAARQRLEGALSKVVETRETARGVIVNLPDILFASGRSTLRPRAPRSVEPRCGDSARDSGDRAQHRRPHRQHRQRRPEPAIVGEARPRGRGLSCRVGGSLRDHGDLRLRRDAADREQQQPGRASKESPRGNRHRKHRRSGAVRSVRPVRGASIHQVGSSRRRETTSRGMASARSMPMTV